jgi:hypothetical protein
MDYSIAIPDHLPERLTISFWLWGLLSTGQGDVFYDLENRIIELKERGFNCIRIDSGAGLCHDAQGNPRGQISLDKPFPGHSQFFRQMECFQSGYCDVLHRLVALFKLARQYDVKVILSSWFYLHTFWYVDNDISREMFTLSPEERFNYFARALDFIIMTLKEHGLEQQIAFAEIFNEADGLPFTTDYGKNENSLQSLHLMRSQHEEALDFLRGNHSDILFAVDTYTAYTELELLPRNAQIWNYHPYYMWSVYSLLEGDLIHGGKNLRDPASYADIRKFLRPQLVSIDEIKQCRHGRTPAADDWCRRIWVYRNVNPVALPELEASLSAALLKDIDNYQQRAVDAVSHAEVIRKDKYPGIPMVVGEAATYCRLISMRWEERSDAYWAIIESTVKLLRSKGYWGCMLRTNSGPDDPSWTEKKDRLIYLNGLFLKD